MSGRRVKGEKRRLRKAMKAAVLENDDLAMVRIMRRPWRERLIWAWRVLWRIR